MLVFTPRLKSSTGQNLAINIKSGKIRTLTNKIIIFIPITQFSPYLDSIVQWVTCQFLRLKVLGSIRGVKISKSVGTYN